MHQLAAQHGISEERLSEISRKTGLSQAQMADKAEACKYLEKREILNSTLRKIYIFEFYHRYGQEIW